MQPVPTAPLPSDTIDSRVRGADTSGGTTLTVGDQVLLFNFGSLYLRISALDVAVSETTPNTPLAVAPTRQRRPADGAS